MTELVKNIYQRINAVMKEVAYIKKDASISGGGPSYKAVTHDQVISVCRSKLVEAGIVMFPEQIEGEMIITRDLKADIKMHLYSGVYNINFVNIDSPEDRITVAIHAHASDNGDKAPGKCITYATKSAILKILCLETGENDESREEIRESLKTISSDQFSQLKEHCLIQSGSSVAWTPVGQKLSRAYNLQSLDQLPSIKFEEALKRCTKAASNADN